jgi:hypothetical protein
VGPLSLDPNIESEV